MSIKALSGVIAFLAGAAPTFAAETEIFPGDSFREAVKNLEPGDTLVVHAGTYPHSDRIAIDARGTRDRPVLITGAPGEARPTIRLIETGHNAVEISGASYVTIRGLEITAPGMRGADGIHMKGGPSHITIEDNVIHDVAVGINFRSSMHHIITRGNEIYDTRGTGEGLYVGCHDGSCSVTHSIIEQNYIHHTLDAKQGDGIEIKLNSHSNVVRDNVIHDTRYPCILLYGAGNGNRNVVERNVMWNCGDSGIQAAADVLLRNNVIVSKNSRTLTSQSHNGVSPTNVEVVGNTLVGGSYCLRLRGWGHKTGMIFANNAVYCAGASHFMGSLAGAKIAGNVFEAPVPRFPRDGYTLGRSRGADFVDPTTLDLYPSPDSPLIGAGDAAHALDDDFNGAPRSGSVDAGAYAWAGVTNPGWKVTTGFKGGPGGRPQSFSTDEQYAPP